MRPLLCLVIACAVGCSGSGAPALKLYPITGSLLVDGKPVADTTVMLMPVKMDSESRPAIGRTDSEGKFKIATNGNRGATVGQYKVVLVAEGEVALPDPATSSGDNPNSSSISSYVTNMETKTKPKPAFKFPKEWASAKTTPKTIEVKEEAMVLEIDI